MGESNKYRRKFFSGHPVCCFCGGVKKADEIEHIPPRFMFLNKHRPAGFEFPTCRECNRASRKTDTVVAFLSKFGSLQNLSEKYQADFDIAARGLFRHCPETYEEITNGRYGNKREEKKFKNLYGESVAIVSLGPKQKEHINLFGLKLTLATYYSVASRIASKNSRITVYMHTSKNLLEDTLPRELDFLGRFRTMQQGTWSVSDQFLYRYALVENNRSAVFQFVLHNNLVLSTFIFDDPEHESTVSALAHTMTIDALRPVSEKKRSPFPSISMSISQPSYHLA